MFISQTGNIYFGEMAPGDRPATDDEISAHGTTLAWLAYQSAAQLILDFNDGVATRCIKAGVAYPAEWLTQDIAARAIVRATSGDPTHPLPPRPSTFPAGT